jgi:hypothetical protein
MENWKKIEGFRAYEVSDLGRVRRCQPSRGTTVGKVLRPGVDPNGRLIVSLCVDGKSHTKMLHVLVAKAFIPNPKHLPEVNHLKTLGDVRAVDLEWRSKEGNEQHAVKNARKGRGVRLDKRRGTYEAYYNVKGKQIHIGMFREEEEALIARQAAVKALKEVL